MPSRVWWRNRSLGESGKPGHSQHYCDAERWRIFHLCEGKMAPVEIDEALFADETGKQTFETPCVENWRCIGNPSTLFTG